jgi:hypothetical protein
MPECGRAMERSGSDGVWQRCQVRTVNLRGTTMMDRCRESDSPIGSTKPSGITTAYSWIRSASTSLPHNKRLRLSAFL